jgi:hypothetical protein
MSYRDRTLIDSTREPPFEACRALVAISFEMWGGKSYPRMIVHNIEKGAKLTVAEGETTGPRFARYQPHRTRMSSLAFSLEIGVTLVILALVAAWRFTPPPRALATAAAQTTSIHIGGTSRFVR